MGYGARLSSGCTSGHGICGLGSLQAPSLAAVLVCGALFGYGLCGVCPGPAIAGLGAGQVELLWALAGIFARAGLQGWQASR